MDNMKLKDIQSYPQNAKKHSKKQIEQIAASIKNFGMHQPIIVDKKGIIIVGHGRYHACKLLEIEPEIKIADLTEEQANAYRFADNKLNESEWDMKLALPDLKLLSPFMFELTGFDKDLLIEPDEKDDIIPENVPARSKLGDLYELGQHRVFCGDSTKLEDVERLMDGKKIDLVYTDPPYGINESGDRLARGMKPPSISGRLAKGKKYVDFKDNTNQYAIDAYNICESLKIPRQVWWGANYYCHSLPLSNNWFVWDKRVEEKMIDTQSDCELAWVKSKWSSIRIFRHLWKGMMKDSEHGEARVHATQKPIALAIWAFDYFKEFKSVLDLFLGSGSTLIASEKTGRICYGMELEPLYVDVIVQRYVDYTGNESVILNNKPILWKKSQKTVSKAV